VADTPANRASAIRAALQHRLEAAIALLDGDAA
jgi:hypothetical protein